MELDQICQKRHCQPLLFILAGWLILLIQQAPAATLYVTNYGAIGDCTTIAVNITSNSAVMHTTNTFTAGDVGKIVQLYGAGYFSALSSTGGFQGNYSGTPTNHQDLVASILSISQGTNVTLSRVCGNTSNNVVCTYGTQNKTQFDNCIAAAQSNDVIRITAGNYLLMPPSALDTNFNQKNYPPGEPQYVSFPALLVLKGALHFLGDGTSLSILTGNGAWQQKGNDGAYRGFMFHISTVTNNGPLIFDSLQFNGAATPTPRTYTGYPATPTDGEGWDPTHHAVMDTSADSFIYLGYTNCLFVHWHGETLQGTASGSSGFVDVGHCVFSDGYSTVLNYYLSHNYHDNWVDTYHSFEEGGQGAGTQPSFVINNILTNMANAALSEGIGGADSNTIVPLLLVSNNYYNNGGVTLTSVNNVNIISNRFDHAGITVGGVGQQTTSFNTNIYIQRNYFTNSPMAISVLGASPIGQIVNLYIRSNTAAGLTEAFAESSGYSSNVFLSYNTANKGLDSTLAGTLNQWMLDDLSNDFPPKQDTDGGGNNRVTYAYGSKHALVPNSTNAVFYLDDSKPAQIPPMAVLLVTNTGLGATLYTSRNLSNPIAMTNGYSARFKWTNGAWHKVFPPPKLYPP